MLMAFKRSVTKIQSMCLWVVIFAKAAGSGGHCFPTRCSRSEVHDQGVLL